MKHLLSRRRALGVAVGLVAGWWAAGVMNAQAQRLSERLEGTWQVTVTPADNSSGKEMKLTLVFKPAEFSVTEWEKQGFKAAPYETDQRRFGPVKFDATLTNEKDGDKAKWSGTANGEDLSGEMTLTKKNGDEVKYTFSGKKK